MIKKLRYLCTLLLIAVASSAWGEQVTVSYSGGTTTNMTGGNDAALVGLNASEWSVVSEKGGGTNHVGLNKDGSIRLYWNEKGSTTLTISSLTGATINSITLTCKTNYDNASVSVDGTEVSGNDGEYEINASSFVIGNANTTNVQVHITSIVIDYTPSVTPTKKNPTVAIGTTTIEVGGTTTVTTNGPELTLATSDDAIASVSGNTVKGVAAGTATITATWSENAEYFGGTKTFDITVKEVFVIQDGVFDFTAGENYGSEYEPGNVKVQSGTWTAVNVTMAAAGRNCWYNGTSFRLYKASGEDAAGTMTFAVPSGKVIKKILFDGSNTMDQVAASTGSYTVSEDLKTGTWEGSANSVTFTAENATKTAVFNVITVTYGDGDEPPVVVVPAPTFNPAAGEVEAGTTVEIICPDGADGVEYSFDKSNWTEYTTPIEITEATTIYAQAYDEEGNYSEVVSAAYTIKQDVPAYETVTLPYEETLVNSQGKFVIENVSLGGLESVWKTSSYGMTANGYNCTGDIESWFVSPLIVTGDVASVSMTFEQNLRYFANNDVAKEQATLWVREGADGSWVQLTIPTLEIVNNNDFSSAGVIDLSDYIGKTIQLGFKYLATTTNPGRWELKNLVVKAGEIVEKQEAGLSYDVANFTATIGEDNVFPVLQNPNELEGISYSSSHDDVATVDENGTVTLVAAGQTTIKASFAGNDDFMEGSASYMLVVKEKEVAGTDKFELVKDASDLKANDVIIIVFVGEDASNNSYSHALSTTQNPNNRAANVISVEEDGTIIPGTSIQQIKLEDGWYFNVGDGYLYAASSSKNWLRTETTIDDDGNAQATINIEDETATIQFQGTNERNKIFFNPNNGTPIFSCYASQPMNQQGVATGFYPQIYRKVTSTETHSGNVNGDPDGKVDIADVTALVNIIVNNSTLTPEQLAAGDFDNSGTLTVEDVEALVNKILSNQ
ncbi:MAG: choice-of-anchor J domain-containing protein [Prevotella sp.]|nr:choice-of-anchor J domain-containing protein [Prevotella sp.]